MVSILSLLLAISSLVLALSVYSGYETTMRQTITDFAGHLIVTKKGGTQKTAFFQEQSLRDRMTPMNKHIVAYTPFLSSKSLIVHQGHLSGALLEGMPPKGMHQALGLQKHLIDGSMQLNSRRSAIIGRGIAKKWQLKIGDSFHVIIPIIDASGISQTASQDLYVEGILDVGFHELNSRLIIVNIQTIRHLLHQSEGMISGWRILVSHPRQVHLLRQEFLKTLGSSYQVSDWQSVIKSVHASYLQAIHREKILIFLILMVLVMAGAFNVFSHLMISVLNQTREICILKIMGASQAFIFYLFILQGFFISFFA